MIGGEEMRGIFTMFALAAAACLCTAVSQPALAQAAPDALGDWHGVLTTPGGPLRLIITVSRAADGTLRADLESPDQAPGQKIPATAISTQGDELSFTIEPLRISYRGKWATAAQSWQGTFTQGTELPLSLSRK
jgi:uncharacterized protein